MAVGEEKRLISREPAGWGRQGTAEMDEGGEGAELGEREQEKFTGEWVDATRPSNRRLDYSAQHIGVCMRARTCVYVFVFPRVSFFSARNIVYLYTPFAPSPFFLTQSASSRFFLLPIRFLRSRSRSLALAWIACVNVYPMGNELAIISILERLAPPRRRCNAPAGSPLGMSLQGCGARDYLPATYPRPRIINE